MNTRLIDHLLWAYLLRQHNVPVPKRKKLHTLMAWHRFHLWERRN